MGDINRHDCRRRHEAVAEHEGGNIQQAHGEIKKFEIMADFFGVVFGERCSLVQLYDLNLKLSDAGREQLAAQPIGLKPALRKGIEASDNICPPRSG